MFTVGEFSKLAQVSKRLLRYYDEIGLLKPLRIDPASGYRYYSAEQLPQLNRILALKDLGLSLGQIRQMMSDHVSTDEMQGMLLLKKAEIERQMRAELHRIRRIESRLQFIRNSESGKPLDVIIKQTPALPVISTRRKVETFGDGLAIFRQLQRALPAKGGIGLPFTICHSDEYVEHDMDLEMGFILEGHPPTLSSGDLERRELPAVESMATTIVQGSLERIHAGYAEIGTWAEANGYRLAGTLREITLQFPTSADGSDLISEIQIPLTRRD